MSNNVVKNSDSIVETLVDVNRVTKVVEGGRNFSFSAIVVVGDQTGKVGKGTGKAKEVAEARAKATKDARRNMINVPLYDGRTIYHDIIGHSGAAKVLLRRAEPGTGVIAGGPMRAVLNSAGIKDIVCKSLGSNNPNAMIDATFNALGNLKTPKSIAEKRGCSPQGVFTNSSKNKKD